MTPEITIIIPVYNVESYLPRCIDSVLNQTFTNFELILVDDGSPDNCGIICDEYTAKDCRIKVIHQTNSGVSVARNTGIATATGKYIAFIDSDDYIERDYLETLYSCQCDLPICGRVVLSQDNKYLYSIKYSSQKYTQEDTIPYPSLYKDNVLYSPVGRLFRHDIIKQNNITFPTHITWGEDGMFVADYLPYVKSLEVLPYTGYCYIKYSNNRSLSTKVRYDICEMISLSRNYCIEKINDYARDTYEAVSQVCTEDIYCNCAYFLKEVIQGSMTYSEKKAVLSHFLECKDIQQVIAQPEKYFPHNPQLQQAIQNNTCAQSIINKYIFLHMKNSIKNRAFSLYATLPDCLKRVYRTLK